MQALPHNFARAATASSLLIATLALPACQTKEPGKATEVAAAKAQPAAKTQDFPAPSKATPAVSTPAVVGQPAPGFTLKDLDGKTVALADHKGKTVVIEWFNPECPFVKLSHTKGSLKGLAKKYSEKGDVVWLAVNSGGSGRQGHGVEKNRQGSEAFGLEHPVLLDADGKVGRAYGATNTPHMFIVDPKGKLVYAGAIDNSPDAEGQAPSGGQLINYVSQALDELAQGKPVSIPKTKAYGCSVKYAKS